MLYRNINFFFYELFREIQVLIRRNVDERHIQAHYRQYNLMEKFFFFRCGTDTENVSLLSRISKSKHNILRFVCTQLEIKC